MTWKRFGIFYHAVSSKKIIAQDHGSGLLKLCEDKIKLKKLSFFLVDHNVIPNRVWWHSVSEHNIYGAVVIKKTIDKIVAVYNIG
jgi:hypothetical protein